MINLISTRPPRSRAPLPGGFGRRGPGPLWVRNNHSDNDDSDNHNDNKNDYHGYNCNMIRVQMMIIIIIMIRAPLPLRSWPRSAGTSPRPRRGARRRTAPGLGSKARLRRHWSWSRFGSWRVFDCWCGMLSYYRHGISSRLLSR